MMPLLEFAFQSFWHFIGTLMLLGVVMMPFHTLAVGIAAAIGGKKND